MDLLEDLNGILQGKLRSLGYVTQRNDTRSLLTGLINLQDKTVSIKKRNVYVSKELRIKEIENPYDDYLKQVRSKFKIGKDVNPHLSKMSLKPQKKDLLLYDWGIHHLHLNNQFDDKGFIERSDYLLFFMLKEDDVYLIDVTKHQLEDRTEFSQQNLLKIVKNNWSYLLEPFKMKGVIGLSQPINDKSHSILRNSGVLTFVEIEGEVFMPMGGGISTAKTNINHTRNVDYIFDVIRDLELDLTLKQKKIKEVTSKFNILYVEADIKLILENNNFLVVETKSGNKVCVVRGLYENIVGHLFEI